MAWRRGNVVTKEDWRVGGGSQWIKMPTLCVTCCDAAPSLESDEISEFLNLVDCNEWLSGVFKLPVIGREQRIVRGQLVALVKLKRLPPRKSLEANWLRVHLGHEVWLNAQQQTLKPTLVSYTFLCMQRALFISQWQALSQPWPWSSSLQTRGLMGNVLTVIQGHWIQARWVFRSQKRWLKHRHANVVFPAWDL